MNPNPNPDPNPDPNPNPAIIQGFAQLGSDLLVDFDLMMTIPILGASPTPNPTPNPGPNPNPNPNPNPTPDSDRDSDPDLTITLTLPQVCCDMGCAADWVRLALHVYALHL